MGVDLQRIRTGISSGSSRTGFGNIVSFPSVPSFPAAGSYNSTLNDVEYPIAEGGASVTVLSVAYPSQTCDVDVENDGAGGTYTDWTTATDVQYKSYGGLIYTDPALEPAGIEVPSGSSNYFTGGTYQNSYYHDGAGSSYVVDFNYSYYNNGTNTNLTGLDSPATVQVPSGGSYYNDGTYAGYTWNGSGGYNYPVSGGSYYPNNTFITFVPDSTFSTSTEVPSGSGNFYDAKFCGDDYFWNGYGGTNGAVPVCKYYPFGTPVGTGTYCWDGTGGYYT